MMGQEKGRFKSTEHIYSVYVYYMNIVEISADPCR